MLDSARKQELIDELRYDLESYIRKQELIQEFIYNTCHTDEEIAFVQGCEWWVSIVGDD
jgi:cupin superfamily acireductone dioxygenase involved in methionine salvage